MQSEPQKQVDEKVGSFSQIDILLNRFTNVSDKEKNLNTEIVEREYSLMRHSAVKPFFNNPSDFKSWIEQSFSLKLLMVLTSAFWFLGAMFFNFSIGGKEVFLIGFSSLVFLLLSTIFNLIFFKNGARKIFKKFNISIKNNNDSVKVLSLFSVFLNNSLVDYSTEVKKETLKKVFQDIKDKRYSRIYEQLNSIIGDIDSRKYYFEKIGVYDALDLKKKLSNKESIKDVQYDLIRNNLTNRQIISPNNSPCYDIVSEYENSPIKQEDIDLFIDKVIKDYKKEVGVPVSFFNDGETMLIYMSCSFFLIPILFLSILSSPVLEPLFSSYVILKFLLFFTLLATPFIIPLVRKKREEKFFSRFIKKESKFDLNNVASNFAMLSLALRTTAAKQVLSDSERNDIVNSFFKSYVGDSNHVRIESLLKKIEEKNKQMENKKIQKRRLEDLTRCDDINLDNLESDVIEAKKNMFFNS